MADITGRSRWEDEDEYWRSSYSSRPYSAGSSYDEWRPAYRFGYESADRYRDRTWDEVQSDLERDWQTYQYRGENRSTWQQVKDAARDAWERVTGRH